MQDASPQSEQAPHERSLTQLTSRGFFWMLLQTIGSKPLALVGQLILAKILLNEQWGLVGLAYSVSVWAELIQQAGLREILIRRHEEFDRLENPVFWLSLALGALATLFLIAAAPLAAGYYEAPQLVGLLYVLALSLPLSALGVVSDAKLQIQMRYRAVAAIMFSRSVGGMILSVVLAVSLPSEFGAYSFVVPFTVFAGVKTIAGWWLAAPRVRLNPEVRLWKDLLGDGVRLFVGSVLLWVTNMVGVIVLGRMHDEVTVGDFYFAFFIGTQVSVLETNLQQVLLPSLSRLQHEADRLRAAFLRAARGIELVGAPAAIFVAALAEPGLRAVFGDKWDNAILPLQTISFGVAMSMTALSSVAMMKATGRFNRFVILYAFWSIVYGALSLWGASQFTNGATGVAIATTIFYVLLGPVNTFAAIQPFGGRMRDVIGVFAAPLVAALVGIGGVAWAATLIPDGPLRDWLRMAVIVIVGLPLCFILQGLLAPKTVSELLSQLEHMLGRSVRATQCLRVLQAIAASLRLRTRSGATPEDSQPSSRQ